MAKDADRKRKLEQDHAELDAKRLKQAKADAAEKVASTANGESAGSPMVVISRTETNESSKSTPKSSRRDSNTSSGRRVSKTGEKSAERSSGTPSGALPSAADPTPSSSSKKSTKNKRRKSAQQDGHKAADMSGRTKDTEAGTSDPTRTTENGLEGQKRRESGHSIGESMDVDHQHAKEDDATKSLVQRTHQNAAKKSRQERKLGKQERRLAKRLRNDGLAASGETTVASEHGWYLSEPGAGRYLSHDPIFVEDEMGQRFLIAATNREVQLLSLESSLVVRKHVVPDGRTIACYSRSASEKEAVDIAYDNGIKMQWKWSTSQATKGTFPGQETTIAMSTSVMHDDRSELFYITRSRQAEYAVIGERKSLFTTQRRLKSIQVLHNAAYIVCVSATALILGSRKSPTECDYIWVEVPVQKPICCADARLVFANPSKKTSSRRPDVAVAIGDTEGQVHFYSSLSSIFATPSQAKLPSPRILHWHREPVSAVKISKDGNYILSGGKETVLVLWQLETGRRQFLPHLTAEIENIVVSSDGTRYALQMGDNSIMVLSSSELKPVANFAGLQLATSGEQMEAEGIVLPETTAILHPKDPHRLLLSVPATQPKTAMDVIARPFLQTFDIRNGRHISRQALDRNNVTDLQTGPERTPITPPDVNLLSLSADGKWLATVDEWYPPGTDLEHVVHKTTGLDAQDVQELRDQQQHRREVHLKFWRWDEASEMWTLSTKANIPHGRFGGADADVGGGSILKMASDPASNCFATIGSDSNVKIWRPKTRTRHGLSVKEPDGTDSIDWVCTYTIVLPAGADTLNRADSPMEEADEVFETEDVTKAALVFSQDGSMLACTTNSTDEHALPIVHLVSPSTGSFLASKSGLVAAEQELLDFGFIDHYFISLSTNTIRVWNLIDDNHLYTVHIPGQPEEVEDAMLAINHFDETFAVISYVVESGFDQSTPKVQVYSPKSTESLLETELSAIPAKLLAANGAKGYTILFEDGSIRLISSTTGTAGPKHHQPAIEPPRAESSALAVVGQQDVEMADFTDKTFGLPGGEYGLIAPAAEDDRPVVRPEQLTELFDAGDSVGLPPVRDMFQAVVGLFARKPRSGQSHQLPGEAMEVEVLA